jgi:hypothetical protein
MEGRVFSKMEYGAPTVWKRAVIMDVRSSFAHQMSRPPRSFHAYWKDWDLEGYTGEALRNKTKELQRLLRLNGVELLSEVIILGPGLKGRGDEFKVASTLMRLGIKRLRFLTDEQAREALVVRNLPQVENAPAWSQPLGDSLSCRDSQSLSSSAKLQKADLVIGSGEKGRPASVFFDPNLQVKKEFRYPKGMRLRIYSPDSHWAFGVALHLLNQGRQPCVL